MKFQESFHDKFFYLESLLIGPKEHFFWLLLQQSPLRSSFFNQSSSESRHIQFLLGGCSGAPPISTGWLFRCSKYYKSALIQI